jgi:hypothetical protein
MNQRDRLPDFRCIWTIAKFFKMLSCFMQVTKCFAWKTQSIENKTANMKKLASLCAFTSATIILNRAQACHNLLRPGIGGEIGKSLSEHRDYVARHIPRFYWQF